MKNMNTEIDNSSDDISATIRILKLKPEQNLEKSGQIYGTVKMNVEQTLRIMLEF